ncbi:TonB-dependent receptor domain-containing protein [Kordiimonas pumila]|uniref:TonB-dependent receptor domain-containing protein n=1 Tax=Kordiimonas pumila TaxID=2161677 RepID=A0ABV7D6F6_9PROT|nr:TonB-dependent receptor [Kordiimonas pumila]
MFGLKNSTAALALMAVSTMSSYAQDARVYTIDIKAQSLTEALTELSEITQIQLLYAPEQVSDITAGGVSGNLDSITALGQLLKNTNLKFQKVDETTYVIVPKSEKGASYQKTSAGYRTISYGENYKANLAVANEDEMAENAGGFVLEDIVVTANRRAQNLQDVPLAISVANPDDFKNKGLVSLSDILAYTPGLSTNNEGLPPGLGTLTARGVGQFSHSPVVGVYMDDVPVNSNLSTEFFIDASLQDVERVELLKGPQGTLYGSTSLGGAVKYILRKPELEQFRGDASANLSTTKDGGTNQLYSARVSTPIVSSKLGITLSGFYQDDGGLYDFIDLATGDVIKENGDNYERYGYSADVLWMLTDSLEVRLNYTHQSTEWAGPGMSQLDADYNAIYGDFRTTGNPDDVQNIKTDLYSGTINYNFDWATLTSVTAYLKSPKLFLVDQNSAGVLAFINSLDGHPTGTDTGFPTETTTGYKKFVQELRLTSETTGNWEWLFGLYYTDEEAPTRALGISAPSDWVVFDTNTVDSYKEYAVFGNIKYYFTPDIDLTIGGRLSRQNVGIDTTVTGHPALVGAGGVSNVEIKDTADTWSFAFSYRPSEALSLYARAASGFRPARTNPPGAPITSPDVKSDSLWSYEVGAKGYVANGLISYDAAVWYINWNKFQTLVPIFGANYIGNAESGVTAKGFEGTVTVKPFEGFSVLSTLAYTDSKLDNDEPVIFGLKDQRVPGLAKWTASMNARYDFAFSGDMMAHVGGGFRYSSAAAGSFDDGSALSPSFNFPAESYVLADVNAGITFGEKYAVNFYATNLFNNLVYTNTSYEKIFGALGVPARPRTLGMVLSVDF